MKLYFLIMTVLLSNPQVWAALAVSNFDSINTSGGLVVGSNYLDESHTVTGLIEWATGFTTGSNTEGYRIEEFVLKFGYQTGGSVVGDPSDPSISIYQDNAGSPGETTVGGVYSLTQGDPYASGYSDLVFNSAIELVLSPNTTYWVVPSADLVGSVTPSHYEWTSTRHQ